MSLTTDRLSLPLLAAGQAQKELTHNESLALIDSLIRPTVVATTLTVAPASPAPGQCWIIASGATGAWAGRDGALAAWTAGGWRFVAPFEGMQVWSIAEGTVLRRAGAAWLTGAITAKSLSIDGIQVVGPRGAAIASPTGGTVVDAQSRTAISAMLAMLRAHGLITI
jgi:hypothetical protein